MNKSQTSFEELFIYSAHETSTERRIRSNHWEMDWKTIFKKKWKANQVENQ